MRAAGYRTSGRSGRVNRYVWPTSKTVSSGILNQARVDTNMDESRPKHWRYRFRLNTLLLLIVIVALLLQLYLQTSRLQQSRAHEEAARADAVKARMLAEAALVKAQALSLQAQQAAAAPLPQTNSGVTKKQSR